MRLTTREHLQKFKQTTIILKEAKKKVKKEMKKFTEISDYMRLHQQHKTPYNLALPGLDPKIAMQGVAHCKKALNSSAINLLFY